MNSNTFIVLLLFLLGLTVANIIIQHFWNETNFITASASSTSVGDVNLTIQSSTALSNQQGTIDFGSGRVNASCDFCQMDSNSTTVSLYSNGSNMSQLVPGLANCCAGFTLVTAGFLLENTGSSNISIGYTCTGNCTFASFIGGTRNAGIGGLELRAVPNVIALQSGETGALDTASSCPGGSTLFRDGQWNITNSSSYNGGVQGKYGNSVYTTLSSRGHWLCGNYSNPALESDNTKDAAVIDINITIPQDAQAGAGRSSFRLTFNGTDASG